MTGCPTRKEIDNRRSQEQPRVSRAEVATMAMIVVKTT
jgi:hypothetical protein